MSSSTGVLPEPTHVLMVCSQFPPVYGGAGNQAALLAETLTSRGHTVEVVTLDQAQNGTEWRAGYRVSRWWQMPATGSLRNALATLALSIHAVVRIARTRPSVVHVHGIYWWTLFPVLLAKVIGAKSVIKSTRDGEDDPYTVIRRRAFGMPIGWLYGASVRTADAIVVLNSGAAMESARQAGVAHKTHLLRNGVDEKKFARTAPRRHAARLALGVGPDTRIVTFVGYLVEHKGVPELLEAWKSIGMDDNLELWLVGPSSGFYRELTDKVPATIIALQEAGLLVREFGHVDANALPEIYWATDVFTLPSHAEGMPNSLAEALVGGCQVVATAIPGIIDIMDETHGWLVPPGDTPALQTALTDALSSSGRSSTEAGSQLGIEQVTSSYERLYGALSNHSRGFERG